MFKDFFTNRVPTKIQANPDTSICPKPKAESRQIILNVIIGAATVSYPFLIWFSADYFQPRSMALGLAGLFLLRYWLQKQRKSAGIAESRLILACALFLLLGALVNDAGWLLAYPVFVSLLFFAVFAFSLIHPPTVVERLARLEFPDLPAHGVLYTRKVTLIWSVFFLGNAAISLLTICYGDRWLWSLYNGCISYVLMGLLMAAEMAVRRKVKASF
ncbi:hypothetical protein [Methylomonas sp. ZR1]|uniref:COG4648 family protein n=1 Tax=Methylomonas sp. ZR1 TaxID=1797072 RepID=UPI0020A24946|nr:hypothetical protein [Methylomonas sp. ZR1]NOV29615.1 hypothetical protein [Methylomonas sp. ZR1]